MDCGQIYSMYPIRRFGRIQFSVAAGATLLLSAGCSSSEVVAGSPVNISVVTGANQTATVGTVVSIAPSFVIKDGNGNGVAGVTVHFAASNGGSLGGVLQPTENGTSAEHASNRSAGVRVFMGVGHATMAL